MKLARPTPAEERWLALAVRYPALRPLVVADGRTGGWTGSTWPSRLLYTLLGIATAIAIHGSLLWLPATGLASGMAMLLLAELLVTRRRVLRSGLEDALHACGAVAIVFEVADGGSHEAFATALLALALWASGLRLSNAVVTTLAALVASVAIALAARDSAAAGLAAVPAAIACAAAALVAMAAGGRLFLRPSHDRMLDGLVLALPVAAWAWATLAASREDPAPGWRGLDALPALLATVLGVACLVIGLRRRSHAALFAALACAAGFAHALRDVLPWPGHLQWIGWGLLLLVVAVALERALREPRSRITSRDLGEATQAMEFTQLAGSAVVPQVTRSGDRLAAGAGESAPPVEGQGGQFGGGGATGRY